MDHRGGRRDHVPERNQYDPVRADGHSRCRADNFRIPLPFWAFIPTLPTEPYVALAGQAEQLLRVLSYLSKRGMYALLDLHALPGSQNGEESSGQNTTSPAWFGNVVNQARSDQLVLAVLDFIANSPWRGTIAGLEVINEPRPYTPAQNAELADYFARSYATIQRAAWPVPMFVHHGFIGSDPLGYWAPFVAARATSPASIVMEDQYILLFPSTKLTRQSVSGKFSASIERT